MPNKSRSTVNAGEPSQAGVDLEDKKQKKLPLFRTIDRYRNLTQRPLDQSGMYRMLKARAKAAGIRTDISAHTARATGITSYLENRGKLEQARLSPILL